MKQLSRIIQPLLHEHQVKEELRREAKAQDRFTQLLVRQGEEWCVDVSPLKQLQQKEKTLRYLATQMDTHMNIGLLPVVVLMILWIILIPAKDMINLNVCFLVFSLIAIAWLIYHVLRMWYFRRLYTQVKTTHIEV